MYRVLGGQLQVFLAHPGGPLFARKDEGHWSIPKGELDGNEEPLAAALREFSEEVGFTPSGDFIPLGSITQKGGKVVQAWAFAGNWGESQKHECNTFKLEWPPHSGRIQEFTEIDRVGFFTIAEARRKLKESQHPFLDRLAAALGTAVA